MSGVALNRWTMSYFALALLALLGAEGLMVSGYGFPAAAIEAPETLVLVHLVAIGWLSLLMCGALLQFVPVLVATPLRDAVLALPALACLAAGLVALLLGFLQLAGTVPGGNGLLHPSGCLLGVGFALVIWMLGRTLLAARPLGPPARFVVIGLLGLAATVGLGIVFTLVLGGVTSLAPLVELTVAGVPLHAAAGLGGWLTITAMGVSYRLLALFMLAPDPGEAGVRMTLGLTAGALGVAVVAGTAAILVGADLGIVLSAAGGLTLGTLALYGRDMLRLYRSRARPSIELNSRMAAVALGNLFAVAALATILAVLGMLQRHLAAPVFLFTFGWLTGLGLAKLYKIVAFLTWIECYGPVLGRAATPRVQDLVIERSGAAWFRIYFGSVWASTLCLLLETPLGFRAGAAAMLLATAAIVRELVHTRQLANVEGAVPPGARRPRLLVSRLRHA